MCRTESNCQTQFVQKCVTFTLTPLRSINTIWSSTALHKYTVSNVSQDWTPVCREQATENCLLVRWKKKKKKSCKLTASFTFLCPGCDRNKLVTVNLSEGGEGVTSSLLTGLTAQLFPEVWPGPAPSSHVMSLHFLRWIFLFWDVLNWFDLISKLDFY